MRVTETMLAAGRYIGGGCFSSCYRIPNTSRVLLIADSPNCDAEKYGYLAWCMKRLKKYGRLSPEMAMLPEVFEVGKYKGRWYAIMQRYACTASEADDTIGKQYATAYLRRKEIERAARTSLAGIFRSLYPFIAATDLHGGNLMYCASRNTFVVVDPTAETHKCFFSCQSRPASMLPVHAGTNKRAIRHVRCYADV